jgi:hypothetical protein
VHQAQSQPPICGQARLLDADGVDRYKLGFRIDLELAVLEGAVLVPACTLSP